MNLQQLNNTIHNSTKAEFLSQRASWVSSITSLLANASEADIEYFRGHVGRELFRKANLFSDASFIKDDFDSGFRPRRVDPTTGLSGKIISWYDAEEDGSYELNSDGRILSVNDKSGSYDISPNKGVNRSPTIDKIRFDDGGFRKVFFFDRGPSHDNCTFRSYDFSHNFSSDGELNMLMVIHHMKSLQGDTDSQDFIFEAAQNGSHNSGTPRFFLRKGAEDGTTPSYSNSGLGGAFNFNETTAGKQFDNPVNLLFNFHIKNGKQISRLNGAQIKEDTRASVQDVTNEETGNGGIFWGSNMFGGQSLEGGFGEIILYDDFAEDGEFLESYLAKKWGFNIPTIKHFKTFV
jgi:hypothetical protein